MIYSHRRGPGVKRDPEGVHVSLLGWIKSAIGLDRARPREAATHPQAPREQAPQAHDDLSAIHPAPKAESAPTPPIESPPMPAARLQQVAEEPAPINSRDAEQAIEVEPARTIEVAIEVAPAVARRIEVEPERPPAIALEPEGPPSNAEIDRRRAMVRAFFNDYWSSIEEKPASFAERLDHAESYINERVAAGGEAWRLGPATRKQLGLPPSKNR